ncbi:MAG: hypothetical protein IPH72_11725 [Sandaracinaceae bacterium]|nr:hypothetical protein [Sandaracinaceae bacterium]
MTVVARNLITGLDGRVVWYAYVSQTDEFRYDHDQFIFAREERELPWLQFEEVNASGAQTSIGAPYTWRVPLRSAIFAHVRGTIDVVDNVGNVRQQTTIGRIQDEHDAGPQPDGVYEDTTISHSIPTLIPGGQWMWRTAETYLSGDHDEGMQLGHTSNRFNPVTGDLDYTAARAEIAGNVPSFEFDGGDSAESYVFPRLQLIEASTKFDE